MLRKTETRAGLERPRKRIREGRVAISRGTLNRVGHSCHFQRVCRNKKKEEAELEVMLSIREGGFSFVFLGGGGLNTFLVN